MKKPFTPMKVGFIVLCTAGDAEWWDYTGWINALIWQPWTERIYLYISPVKMVQRDFKCGVQRREDVRRDDGWEKINTKENECEIRRGRREEEVKDEKMEADCGGRPHLVWSPWWVRAPRCLLLETDGTVRVGSKVRWFGPTHADASTYSTHLSLQEINTKLCNLEDITNFKKRTVRDAVCVFGYECFSEEMFTQGWWFWMCMTLNVNRGPFNVRH